MAPMKICGAVHVERWSSEGKPREREVRCTMSPGHTGRHGWELDKGEARPSGAAERLVSDIVNVSGDLVDERRLSIAQTYLDTWQRRSDAQALHITHLVMEKRGHDWHAEVTQLRMLVHHFVSLGPRPDHQYAEPTDADIELQSAWDAAWNALVERANNLGVNVPDPTTVWVDMPLSQGVPLMADRILPVVRPDDANCRRKVKP